MKLVHTEAEAVACRAHQLGGFRLYLYDLTVNLSMFSLDNLVRVFPLIVANKSVAERL
ncbi:hypothetical protein AB4Z35_29425 [Pseudomonas sp. KB_15]|uniref:hypothetical protein n=1 Tax=Pseudomonas sp. KB_15 TaxID=3233035 RepID=UPI003F9CFA6C